MDDNDIIEIDSENEDIENIEEEEKEIKEVKKKKNKKSLKDKWDNLSKKNKIIIIIASIVLLLIIIGLIIYFVFFKNSDNETNNKEEEKIYLDKDNYRYEDGRLVFLDKSERVLGGYECTNKDPLLCLVAKSDYSNDTFDREISVYEDDSEIEFSSNIFNDNYVFVKDGDKIFLYDIKGQTEKLEVQSIKTYSTNENLAIVEDENKRFGLIEITEDGFEYLIRCSYDYLGIINLENIYLLAKDKNDYYLIDKNGKKLTNNIKEDVKSAKDDYYVAKDGNSYNLYTLKGEEKLSDYDYIGLHDGIISLVANNRLYLVDNDLNKLYEDGIRLNNNYYVKKYVYDKDNKLIDTKQAYQIETNNKNALVTVDDEVKNINLNDGLVSSKFAYMNYFDGVLYFYSDSEENELIGTYECKNKNTLENSDDTLDNCSIYNTTDGLTGIYNNRYVFIFDSPDTTSNIYLYDLSERKSLGTYSEISILNNSEININMKPIYTSSSYILAKSAKGNNTGNYGILEIKSDKAQGKIEFKFSNIKKVNDYYLMQDTSNIYSVYNHDFKKISGDFEYLEVFDKYYVGIVLGKLNIYTFDNALGILSEGLDVKSNEFTVDFQNGFTITVDGKTYHYDLEGNIENGE